MPCMAQVKAENWMHPDVAINLAQRRPPRVAVQVSQMGSRMDQQESKSRYDAVDQHRGIAHAGGFGRCQGSEDEG